MTLSDARIILSNGRTRLPEGRWYDGSYRLVGEAYAQFLAGLVPPVHPMRLVTAQRLLAMTTLQRALPARIDARAPAEPKEGGRPSDE